MPPEGWCGKGSGGWVEKEEAGQADVFLVNFAKELERQYLDFSGNR